MNSMKVQLFLVAAICVIHTITAVPLLWNRRKPVEADDGVRTFQEGEPIELNCEASGTYQPAFHWLHDDVYIEQGPLDKLAKNLMSSKIAHRVLKVRAQLYIKNSKPEDSGKYTCIADSLTHRVIKSYTVVIERATEKTPTEEPTEAGDDLRIYEWAKALNQEEGSPIYVVCRATEGTTKPLPNITWKIGNKDIVPSDNIIIHSNGDLEVKAVTLDFQWNKGPLQCHAISEDMKTVVSKSTFVYINPLPENDD